MNAIPIAPKLDPPGAGLPLVERLIANISLRLLRRRLDREAVDRWFDAEAKKITELVSKVRDDERSSPVLIKRLRGLEDSSRHWSVYMTLDHLRIVNLGITGIIEELVSPNETSIPETRIQDVKPNPLADHTALDAFQSSVIQSRKRLTKLSNLVSKRRHCHPWFGPLDAKGFHTLLALHMRVHRKQLEHIAEALQP